MHSKRREHLRRILKNRNIDHFIHCTPIENLENILNNGIWPRKDIEESSTVNGYITDPHRFDGNVDASCFSVQEPNLEHMRRIQKRYRDAAIIVVSVEVILSHPCAFYPRNAAKSEFKYQSMRHWQWSDRFEEMFSGDDARNLKDGTPMPSNWTTHADAEVLVFGKISTDYIEEVAIKDTRDLNSFKSRFPEFNFIEYLADWV